MENSLQPLHEKPVYVKKKRRKNYIDITGQRFERWEVLYLDESKDYGKEKCIYWICKCDCGTIRSVAGVRLRKGKSKSCGWCIITGRF